MTAQQTRHTLLAALLMLVFGLTSCQELANQKYPVRWTKHVKLRSLTDLDTALRIPVKIPGKDHSLSLTGLKGDKIEVRNGIEYLSLKQKKYHAYSTYDLAMESWFKKTYEPLSCLASARSSSLSHVESLSFRGININILPPELGPFLGSDDHPIAVKVKKGLSWSQVFPDTEIVKATSTELTLQSLEMEMNLQLLAYGDFNHDTVEDILVFYSLHALKGTHRYFEVLVLSRKTADGRLLLKRRGK